MRAGQVTKRGPVLQRRMIVDRWSGALRVWLESVPRNIFTELVLYRSESDGDLFLVALVETVNGSRRRCHHHIGSIRRVASDPERWLAYGGVSSAYHAGWPARGEAMLAVARSYLSRLDAAIRELSKRQERRLKDIA